MNGDGRSSAFAILAVVRNSKLVGARTTPSRPHQRKSEAPTFRPVKNCRWAALALVVLAPGHVSLRDIAGERCMIAFARIAISAAAGTLQQEAFPRRHLVAPGSRRCALLGRAEPDDEAGAASSLAAG